MHKTWLALALSLSAAGCMTGPANGAATAAVVEGKTFTFGGYYDEPNATILLEVLKKPELDPNVDSNWIGFTLTTTGTTPVDINDSPDPLYEWSIVAAPVPANASDITKLRWPQGGLVRIRASRLGPNNEKELLRTFDYVNSDCLGNGYNAGKSWETIGDECEGVGNKTIAVASTSILPNPSAANGFLTDKGIGNVVTTSSYYFAIGAPTTLGNFRQQFGFNSSPASVVSARYYNDGDLGLGREMNCKSFFSPPGIGVACYVRNYSGVDGEAKFNVRPNTVLDQVATGHGAFATVAMIYRPTGGANSVQFIVYDANGNLQLEAPLDVAEDNKSIPQNCLSCHGIDSTFSGTSVSSTAEFLPFDPSAFLFGAAPWTKSAQQDDFYKLNQLVKLTSPPAATVELIDGMYAGGQVANENFIPAAWQTPNTLDGKAVYDGVIKPYCRTCHVSSNNAALDFRQYSDFNNLATGNSIRYAVCGTKKMPHAERVQKKMWQSGARAYITTALEWTVPSYPDPLQACTP